MTTLVSSSVIMILILHHLKIPFLFALSSLITTNKVEDERKKILKEKKGKRGGGGGEGVVVLVVVVIKGQRGHEQGKWHINYQCQNGHEKMGAFTSKSLWHQQQHIQKSELKRIFITSINNQVKKITQFFTIYTYYLSIYYY